MITNRFCAEEFSLGTVQKLMNFTLTGILMDFDCEHSVTFFESVRKSRNNCRKALIQIPIFMHNFLTKSVRRSCVSKKGSSG